jgi:hypothetical protein
VGSVGGLKRLGLIGKTPPIEGFCPWQMEDVTGEPGNSPDGLLELPCGQIGAASEGLEKIHCAGGGIRVICGGPDRGPAEKIWFCLGLDITLIEQLLVSGERIRETFCLGVAGVVLNGSQHAIYMNGVQLFDQDIFLIGCNPAVKCGGIFRAALTADRRETGLPQARAQRPTRALQWSVALVATAFPNHITSLSILDSLASRGAAVAASQCHDRAPASFFSFLFLNSNPDLR